MDLRIERLFATINNSYRRLGIKIFRGWVLSSTSISLMICTISGIYSRHLKMFVWTKCCPMDTSI